MRLISLIILFFYLVGCGDNAGSSTPTSLTLYSAPGSYQEATSRAVSDGGMDVPTGPWDCIPVKVIADAGTVVVMHTSHGSTSYTAGDNGVILNMLIFPKTTLWFTVIAPDGAEVVWVGTHFTSDDATGATWTSPISGNSDQPVHIIQVSVLTAPSGNG